MASTLIAIWSAAGGKKYVTLYRDSLGYSFDMDNGHGGYLRRFSNDNDAIKYVEERYVMSRKLRLRRTSIEEWTRD